MTDILKILFIFSFILFLLRKKINVGYALLAGASLFFIFYSVNLKDVGLALLKGLTLHSSVNLVLSLTLIKSFEYSLRQAGLMQKMTDTAQTIFKNKKFSIISMPLIIGMLPSLGGAYLSAPMVGSATKDLQMSNEERAFINYWYRHPWELILPLYPGIVLASAVSQIPLRELILLNLPVTLIFFVTGFLFSMRNVKENVLVNYSLNAKLKMILNFLPILFVLFPVIFLKVDLFITLFVCIVGICLFYRKDLREFFMTLKYGFTSDVIVLVVGVIVFREMLQVSHAVDAVARTINDLGIPYLTVFLTLPLFIGLITGLSVGFVGSTFPFLLHLKETLPYEISIAFVAGYVGVLFSPLHLCLILTKQYFNADMFGIYKKIVPAVVVVFFSALIEFVILRYYI